MTRTQSLASTLRQLHGLELNPSLELATKLLRLPYVCWAGETQSFVSARSK